MIYAAYDRRSRNGQQRKDRLCIDVELFDRDGSDLPGTKIKKRRVTMKNYANEVVTKVNEYIEGACIQEVTKNNGITKTGIQLPMDGGGSCACRLH